MTEDELTDDRNDGNIDDMEGVARLLSLYAFKPPKVTLTREQRRNLHPVVKKNKDFRQLKDAIRIEAWEKQLYGMNSNPASPSFPTDFAHAKGFREGMLFALDRLEALVETEDDD